MLHTLTMRYLHRWFLSLAVLALALNVVLTLAGMSALGATLTLPGIAGIVLGIGLAVAIVALALAVAGWMVTS